MSNMMDHLVEVTKKRISMKCYELWKRNNINNIYFIKVLGHTIEFLDL